MSKKEPTKAELLLAAHTDFIIESLTGDDLPALLGEELEQALKNAGKLTLNDVVTRDMIKSTVKVYSSELELGSGIPELIGDIARNLYNHEIHSKVSVKDLLTDHQFREFLNKVLEMKEARQQIVREVVSNPLYSALASDILYQGIKGYVTTNVMNKNIPGMKSMMSLGKSVMNLAGSGMDLEEGLKKYIHKNIQGTLRESEHFLLKQLDDHKLKEMAMDVWHDAKKLHISGFRKYISSSDVEEFFVIGYEYWRELRKTGFYSAIIESGIDSFFDKYGKITLAELLDEIGITQEMMMREALRFAPHVLQVLKKKKMLEPLVRRNLERFYLSDKAAAIIG
jgi:hypothetical protein